MGINIPGVVSLSETGISPAIQGAVTLTEGSNVTITQSGQAITIAASSSAANTLTVSTDFSAAARFDATATGGGTATFDSEGLTVNTSGTATSSESVLFRIGQSNFNAYLGSPLVGIALQWAATLTNTGTAFVGIGALTVNGTNITYTGKHIGFKFTANGTNTQLYATQADGTTETASASLVTLSTNDSLDLIFKVNSTTSVDYYNRVNGGALSASTNQTTNIPASAASTNQYQVAASNQAVANPILFRPAGMSYTR